MARKPPLSEKDLQELAIYLANPKVNTVIHAEMKPEKCDEFEVMYRTATNDYPLPKRGPSPYILLKPDANKQSIQLRIYFHLLSSVPESVKRIYTDKRLKKRLGVYCARINGFSIVKQILECGFVLGENNSPSIQARIQNTMGGKFS